LTKLPSGTSQNLRKRNLPDTKHAENPEKRR